MIGQLMANGPTNECSLVVDTDLSHITRIIAERDRLTNISRQGQFAVPMVVEAHAFRMNLSSLRNGQQKQIQLFKSFRQLWQKPVLLPAGERRLLCCSVWTQMILLQKETKQMAV